MSADELKAAVISLLEDQSTGLTKAEYVELLDELVDELSMRAESDRE